MEPVAKVRRPGRLLRSKRLRAALWYAARGKCRICDCDLADDWEADHVIPYSVSRTTNVHGMQALCRACNRSKAAMTTRKHQADTIEFFQKVQARVKPLPKFLCMDCICGGGKSIIPVIVAYFMLKKLGLADKIVWAVPRTSLREQGAEEFLKGKLADRLFGHGLEVCENTNEPNPCKGTNGYITSIQAIVANPDLHRHYFAQHRTVLVLDEFHHIHQRSKYSGAIAPLQSRAVLTVPMSGYWARADGYKLEYMRYGVSGELNQDNDEQFQWIHYGLEDALREKAVIPTHFVHLDGAARFVMQASGTPHEVGTLGMNRNAIFAALHSEYACQLMDKCYGHWKVYKKHHKRSKLLVVCANILQARMIFDHLRKVLREDRVAIATYREDEPDETITTFRKGDRIQVLVTVAMAYEGLDVRSITHLAILTHIRSEGWILQNIARAWRYDPDAGPWEAQVAHVFLPDDLLMRRCIAWIKDIQVRLSVDPPDEVGRGGTGIDGGGDPDGRDRDTVLPESSAVTRERASGLAGEEMLEDQGVLGFCNHLIQKHELPLSVLQCRSLIDDVRSGLMGAEAKGPEAPAPAEEEDWLGNPWSPDFPARPGDEIKPPPGVLPEKTPGQRIKAYKARITEHIGAYANGNGDVMKVINTELKILFGSREACTEETLLTALRYLQRKYPRKHHA